MKEASSKERDEADRAVGLERHFLVPQYRVDALGSVGRTEIEEEAEAVVNTESDAGKEW